MMGAAAWADPQGSGAGQFPRHGLVPQPGPGWWVRWATVVPVLLMAWSDAGAGGTGPAAARVPTSAPSSRARLVDAMAAELPAGPYVVIDTHGNRLQVRTASTVLFEGACATGSGRRLEGPKPWHRWEFATPSGAYTVRRKVWDPIWVRPVWDFVEAGEEIPIFAEDPRRFERGMLGEGAIYFLPDYMIHGTLYEVNLGKSITHGCVRVSAASLEHLMQTVEPGWAVYVY